MEALFTGACNWSVRKEWEPSAFPSVEITVRDNGNSEASFLTAATTKTLDIAGGVPLTSSQIVPGWKSTLDVLCIVLSAPLWLPLMLLLMLVTRVASPGPIFYRQRRVGLGGRPFLIWKFRTMKVSAETQTHERYFEELMRTNCVMTKLDANGDPRLAPFGRILRASGLDELPQVFNVLAGDMSLVGPRPELPSIVSRYTPQQLDVLAVRPGLTGWAQIHGRDDLSIPTKLELDRRYVQTRSF